MSHRSWSQLFRSIVGAVAGRGGRLPRRPNLALERMEDRTVPAAFTYDGSNVLTIDLNNDNEAITLTAQGGGKYVFTSTSKFTGTEIVGTLTIGGNGNNANELSITNSLNLTTILITDSISGTSVNFGASTDNYVDNLDINLDHSGAGGVSVNNATSISGNFSAVASGFTQTASLSVTGAATFAAGSGNNITLNNADNDFASVGITSGKNVTINDNNAVALNASTVSGTPPVETTASL